MGRESIRLAYFAFEITSLDTTTTDLRPTSPTRAAILDAALRWLVSATSSALARDHPDVNITSPNGGVFAGPTLAVDWTAAAYGPGVGIPNSTLDPSTDGGQTWPSVAPRPASIRPYPCNLGGTSNSDRSRL